jgi:hypothetical protein
MLNVVIFCAIVIGGVILFNLRVKNKAYNFFVESPFEYNQEVLESVTMFGSKEMQNTIKKQLLPFFKSISKEVEKSGSLSGEKMTLAIHEYKKEMLPNIEDFYEGQNFNKHEKENLIFFLKELDSYVKNKEIVSYDKGKDQNIDRKLALLGLEIAMVLVLTRMYLKNGREKEMLLYDIRDQLPLSDSDIQYISAS